MKKISKSIKKCLAFCLTASMLISTAATVSAIDRSWTVNYQNGGNVTNTVNFGAVGKGGIHCINLKGNRFAAKALASSDAGTISDESFLILDVNMATNEDGLTIYSQPDGNLPLIQNIPFDKGQWHAVRLVVQKPMLEDEKIPTLGDGTVNTSAKGYLAKHKVYVDGKLAGTYNAVEGDRQRTWDTTKSNWNVFNNIAWGVSVPATPADKSDKYIYTADLRVSSAAEDPGEYTLPSIDANAAFKVLNGNIMPTQAAGVKVSDITSADGDVFVTDTSGIQKTGEEVLADGDRIVVAKDKLYNTYFYKTNHVFYERNDWSGSIGTANGLTATKVNTISGKASTDSSVKVTNSEAAGPYLTFGNFNDIAGADYMVYEVNIMPTDGLDKIQFTTNRAYELSPQINANKLKTDCWNKVIFVVRKNDLHTDGTYLSDVYANGSFDRTATAQKPPGDTVPYVNPENPEIPVTNIRINFTPSSGYVGDLAYVDDVKVYEACYKPEIAPYTVTDSENAVYDKDNNMMYATSNAAIATACDATLASEGNGWVIVNRGNENYSKYNVRTFTANTISHDAATNEFWGKTTSETTAKDKFIAATYDASGRLTGARLIDGTSIGDKILKCTFTPTESSRLFFWNFENLRPHAQSLDVTVSK